MPSKTITTSVTLGVADPAQSTHAVLDASGNVLLPPSVGLGHVPPGTVVTLDAAEADWILARFGGEVVADAPDTPPPAKAVARK